MNTRTLQDRIGNQSMPCGDKEGQYCASKDKIKRHYQRIRLPSKQVSQPHHPCLDGVNHRHGFIVGKANRKQLKMDMRAVANKRRPAFSESLAENPQCVQERQPQEKECQGWAERTST